MSQGCDGLVSNNRQKPGGYACYTLRKRICLSEGRVPTDPTMYQVQCHELLRVPSIEPEYAVHSPRDLSRFLILFLKQRTFVFHVVLYVYGSRIHRAWLCSLVPNYFHVPSRFPDMTSNDVPDLPTDGLRRVAVETTRGFYDYFCRAAQKRSHRALML